MPGIFRVVFCFSSFKEEFRVPKTEPSSWLEEAEDLFGQESEEEEKPTGSCPIGFGF